MKRVVSVFLPSWPTDRLRRMMGVRAPSLETPLVLVGHEGNARVILAADTAARRAGLTVRMAASKAQALLADLVIMDTEQAADAEALRKLAIWAQRLYAPFVACNPPDGLMIDITGAAHLLGGEEALLKDIVRRLASANIDVRAAAAPTYGAAYAFARCVANPIFIATKEELAGALGLSTGSRRSRAMFRSARQNVSRH